MTIHLFAVLALGLMCGSELNVAAFGHPAFNRQPLQVHIPMRSSFAVLFGRVMPFWMGGSASLNLIILLPFEHGSDPGWRLAAFAFAIQVLMILLSLVALVPINNRTARWTVSSLPQDWRSMERRWDAFHWFRTCMLVIAFVFLLFSFGMR